MQVQCYVGCKADERPLRFSLNNHEYLVEEVVDQWYGPEHAFFKLRADDGNLYILRRRTSAPDGDWELMSFRETKPTVGHPHSWPLKEREKQGWITPAQPESSAG
jgi:hypothetical protein